MQRYFAHNAQKSCNITKSFLLQCNSLWQKLPKTLFFQCDLSRNDLSKAENEEKLQLFMSFPKIALHCFPSFHHTNLSPPSQNKTIAKKWIQTHRYRTYILLPIHTCAFVTRMRHFFAMVLFYIFYPHTSSAISFTSFNFAHCCSSVNLLPISQEANPHCGLKYKRSSGIYFAAS